VSDDELVRQALEARGRAHAPYSGYRVGAAARAADGRVFVGANVENASYGLSVCAERSAVIAAALDGGRPLEAIAIATSSSPPAAPCGACRQTLAEFAPDAMRVILVNDRGERIDATLGELLPRAFRGEDLAR
jgi:cytidine deaminase